MVTDVKDGGVSGKNISKARQDYIMNILASFPSINIRKLDVYCNRVKLDHDFLKANCVINKDSQTLRLKEDVLGKLKKKLRKFAKNGVI